MQRRTIWSIFLVTVIVAIGVFQWKIHEEPIAAEPVFVRRVAPAVGLIPEPVTNSEEQILARLEKQISQPPEPNVYDPSIRSFWAESDSKRYTALLSSHACELLVVPMQTLHFGFDRATRSMMTAQVAHAMAVDANRCVVDPYLAARALGDGMRHLPDQTVLNLARITHAGTVLWLYAGHDGNMKMEVVVRLQKLAPGSAGKTAAETKKVWGNIEFSDQHPPFDSWQKLLPEILKLADMPATATRQTQRAETALPIPNTPDQLIAANSAGPLQSAQRFQLLAMLGPLRDFRATERLFEKSWLAAGDAAVTAQSRRIRARALFHLGYRPAALALLEGDDSAESQMLRALLNGNLKEATKLQGGLVASTEKFVASIELQDLGLNYVRVKEKDPMPVTLSKVAELSPAWATLIEARARDLDDWHVGENLPVKALLDAAYPIAGSSLRELATANTTLGKDIDQVEIDLMPTRHINTLLEQHGGKYCCTTFLLQPQTLDFLDLIAARSQANLEKGVHMKLAVQGMPARALELLDAYDGEFSGHPHFSLMRGKTNYDLAYAGDKERSPQRSQLGAAAERSAIFWEQGMTAYSAQALPFDARQSRLVEDDYRLDFPPRPYWEHRSTLNDDKIFERVLAYDVDDTNLLSDRAAVANPDQRRALLNVLEQRFVGAPDVSGLREKLDPERHVDVADALAEKRSMIANDPDNFSPYHDLAQALLENSQFAEAAQAVAGYPGFKTGSTENSVALSNYAAGIGSLLYWRGAIEPSRSLYTIAARYNNGSDANLMAQQRLHVLAGDYAGYSSVALQRAQRYENAFAYRDYLCMLFALGYGEKTWPAFMTIAGRFANTEVWHAAMVGQRVEGSDDKTVRDWILSEPVKNILVDHWDRAAVRYALTYFMVDRPVPRDLGAFVASVEGPAKDVTDTHGVVMHRYQDDYIPGRGSKFGLEAREKAKVGVVTVPLYVLFAEAYAAQRSGNDKDAIAAFNHIASLYRIESPVPDGFVLPYFAMSAAKTGDAVGLKAFLDQLPTEQRLFDFHLAEAVFEGLAGNHDKAREHLRQAFVKRPNTDGRAQLSPYQYAETCLWLFEQTGDTQYRDLALDWARNYQRIDPALAWAYALEARYSPEKDASRLRAIAIAEYLDRNSAWLSGVPKADIEAGKVWLKTNNPFAKRTQQSPDI